MINQLCYALPPYCFSVLENRPFFCTSCLSGYALDNNGVCNVPNAAATMNCRNYNPMAQSCISCADGYQLFGNMCYKLPNNCFFMSPINFCMTCAQGFTQSNGVCLLLTSLDPSSGQDNASNQNNQASNQNTDQGQWNQQGQSQIG